MKNIWGIFKQDIRNIKRVPLVGILLIGLAVLPSFYAWFNISAAWDPYSNTEGIQVAIVNEDKGAEIEGAYINIGDELVDNLSSNENLGWDFVSREEAEKGVEYGDYYASIYIDEKFSDDLAQILTGDPKQANVHYEVNDKINAIAPKMTSAGASTIVNQINEQILEETSKAIFQELDKIGVRLEDELPTFRRMNATLSNIDESFPDIIEFADWIIEADENWHKVEEQLDQFLTIEEFIPQIQSGAEEIVRLDHNFSRINELAAGIIQLEQAIPEIEQALEEVETYQQHFSELHEHFIKAHELTTTAEENIKTAKNKLPSSQAISESTELYINELNDALKATLEVIIPVTNTFTQQILFINETASDINQIMDNGIEEGSLEKQVELLTHLNEEVSSHIRQLENAISMYTHLYNLTGEEDILVIVERLEELVEGLSSLQEKLEDVVNQLEEGEQPGEEFLTSIQEKTKLVEEKTNTINLVFNENSIESTYEKIEWRLVENFEIEDANALIESMEQILYEAEEITKNVSDELQLIIERFPEIELRINELVDILHDDLPTVIHVIEALSSFIKNDLPLIENQVHQLATMAENDLPNVEERYGDISKILEENRGAVKQAINDLSEFSRNTLPEVEEMVSETAGRLQKVEEEEWLSEIIAFLRNDLDEESSFFANPVQLTEEELFPIPNYGSANVPFYTTLSLWVGALLLSNLVSTNVHAADRREEYTLRDIYFGRMILFILVGILQGVIVSVGNLFILGTYAAHPFLLVLFSVIIAVIFMTIVYTCASILGNIGKALAIILLVLQLSSGGGTFPIEVTPNFYQTIHPFMPFSYAIDLLREAVGGAITFLVWKNIMHLLVFWLIALAIGHMLKPLLAARIEETYKKSKSSRLIE
ncbi:YhgE/Pip domain-containing protein [Evansella cellulosilytica]|uniref:YhgE/Pip N-terminal domain protein n=1 Tax=Evansella cellulosilytica (strain ATCC 21833 / DSM 2522 / FERM P-1141 / JCM 9156 / N-4) TaxID=649639 RepID=E6TUS3_EVAC2|nr:YhgE/Pip domain-containing protein [Evansella cellulosilytica]ADU32075.1 YhgE/Pip N-terminal domain protein [Evansella cellulosilytica DSM 2522]